MTGKMVCFLKNGNKDVFKRVFEICFVLDAGVI